MPDQKPGILSADDFDAMNGLAAASNPPAATPVAPPAQDPTTMPTAAQLFTEGPSAMRRMHPSMTETAAPGTMRPGLLPHVGSTLAHIIGGILSAEGGPTGAAISAMSDAAAQKMDSAAPVNKKEVATEGAIGAIPLGAVLGDAKEGVSLGRRFLTNAGRMAGYTGATDAIRRGVEEGASHALPQNLQQAKDDALSAAIGGALGGVAGVAFPHTSANALRGVEEKAAQESAASPEGQVVAAAGATPQRTSPILVRNTAGRTQGGPVIETAPEAAATPITRGPIVAGPARPPVVAPLPEPRMGSFTVDPNSNPLGPVTGPEAPKVAAEKAAIASAPTKVPDTDVGLGGVTTNPEFIRQSMDEAQQRAADLATPSLKANQADQKAEAQLLNKEATADRQAVAAQLGGTDLGTITAKADKVQTAAAKEAEKAAQLEQATRMRDELLANGDLEPVTRLTGSSVAIPTDTGTQRITQSFRPVEEEGGGEPQGPPNAPPFVPIPPDAAGRITIPKTDPQVVASTRYGSYDAALHAMAGSGQTGDIVPSGKGQWFVQYQGIEPMTPQQLLGRKIQDSLSTVQSVTGEVMEPPKLTPGQEPTGRQLQEGLGKRLANQVDVSGEPKPVLPGTSGDTLAEVQAAAKELQDTLARLGRGAPEAAEGAAVPLATEVANDTGAKPPSKAPGSPSEPISPATQAPATPLASEASGAAPGAYKGYLIQQNPLNGSVWVTKDGATVAKPNSIADARTAIDQLTATPGTSTAPALADLAGQYKDAADKYYGLKQNYEDMKGDPTKSQLQLSEASKLLRAQGVAFGGVQAQFTKAYKAAQKAGQDIPDEITNLLSSSRIANSVLPQADKAAALSKNPDSDALIAMSPEQQDKILPGLVKKALGNKDETGAIDPKVARQIAMHVAGGLAGSIIGNQSASPDHKARDTFIGAVAGALAPMLATQGGRATLAKWRAQGMLTSPTTIVKKVLGDTGGVLAEAAEGSFGKLDPNYGKKILQDYFSPATAQKFIDTFKATGQANAAAERYASQPLVRRGPFAWSSRALGAATEATQDALMRAGLSNAAAKDITYLGTPKTPLLETLASLPSKGAAGKLLVPFARIQTNLAEKGAQRMGPLGALVQAGNPANTVNPEAVRRLIARGVLGTGAIGAGYLNGPSQQEISAAPGATGLKKSLETAATGPYALPFALGETLRAALSSPSKSGTSKAGDVMKDLGQSVIQQMPIPRDLNPMEIAQTTMVPNAVRGLARYLDNGTPRKTNEDWLDPIAADIPGLREGLPAKAVPTQEERVLNAYLQALRAAEKQNQ